MKHGDISNKPAKQIMFRLEQIVDEISFTFLTKKLVLELNDLHIINHMNDLFMMKDVQIIIGAVLPRRYQKSVEDFLDEVDLLYKEVILMESEEEMSEFIHSERIEYCSNPYTYEILWI